MKLFKELVLVLLITLTNTISIAQPSESELKKKVYEYYGNSSIVQQIEFNQAKLEKRWVKTEWKYYWSRTFTFKGKTDYPEVYRIVYGGVQYLKNGNSYSFDRILVGGTDEYQGIPNPNVSEINEYLKSSFDPLLFYPSYQMNYLLDAPNSIQLADQPNWKWVGLNELRCDVVSTYTTLINDIGGVQEKKGVFRIRLKRSLDGKTFDRDAGLLKNGKWLPIEKGREIEAKIIKSYNLTQEELANKRTLAQQNSERHAEEFMKSLQVIEMPKFKSANHLMQFTHELMIEGDKDKITAFCYQMFPKYLFEEWSEIVLNKNGKEKLEKILKDIENYNLAFCKHPIIKEIGTTYVRFYDRNKKRMNNIKVSWENDRWYVMEMKYFIMAEDLAGFRSNQETNCGEDPIYLDEEPYFKKGDQVKIFHRGNWYDAEILKPEMHKGGYSVKYGRSGLTEWKYVSQVKPLESPKKEDAQLFKEFEMGQKVKVKYTNVWYEGTILKVNYDKEEYQVEIPQRNIDAWIHNQDIEALDENEKKTKIEKSEHSSSETKKQEKEESTSKDSKSKKKIGSLKNKFKIRIR